MKSLKDSYLFQINDKSSGLSQKMVSYNPTLDDLDLALIEEQLNTIQKRFSYTMKNRVINDITSKKRVVLAYNPARMLLPTSVPAFLIARGDRPTSVVNITKYATRDKNGELVVDTKTLYAMMQTGSLLLGCYENWVSITMNQTICKTGSSMYSKLVQKVFDKLFAINMDSVKSDKFKFLLSKFFLINLLGKSNSPSIDNMAYSNCTNGTPKLTIINFGQEFGDETFKDFNALINAIKDHFDGMGNLDTRQFMEAYIKMYGPSSMFSLEYFPYFCHMIFATMMGAHINMEYIIENIVGKEVDGFYNELNSAMK